MSKNDYTQPHVYCDKELYKEYRTILKKLGKDLMKYNQLVFENAIKKEIEAFENLDPNQHQYKLISET